MNDYLRLLVIFTAAINPPAMLVAMRPTAATWDEPLRLRAAAAGAALAAALLAAAVIAAQPLIDFLEVAPETFRIAAGIVMLASGVMAIWGRPVTDEPVPGWQAGLFPLGLPLLAGPAALVAAVSYSVDMGAWKTADALLPPLALGAALIAWRAERWPAATTALARLLGALLVVIATGLVIEGIRAI